MKTIKITCDKCQKDITETGSMPTYRLHLTSEKLPSNSDFSFSVMVYPPTGDMYFCSTECLKEYFK